MVVADPVNPSSQPMTFGHSAAKKYRLSYHSWQYNEQPRCNCWQSTVHKSYPNTHPKHCKAWQSRCPGSLILTSWHTHPKHCKAWQSRCPGSLILTSWHTHPKHCKAWQSRCPGSLILTSWHTHPKHCKAWQSRCPGSLILTSWHYQIIRHPILPVKLTAWFQHHFWSIVKFPSQRL